MNRLGYVSDLREQSSDEYQCRRNCQYLWIEMSVVVVACVAGLLDA